MGRVAGAAVGAVVARPLHGVTPTTKHLLPDRIDVLLRHTIHEQGYRRRELELLAAVQGVEVLTLELEGAGHDGPFFARPGVSVSRDVHDSGILEDRDVEVH